MKAPKGFTFKDPLPKEYQLYSFIRGIQVPEIALYLHMGLGKSRIAIDISIYRVKENSITSILVVSPLSVVYSWKKEIEKWSEYSGLILHGDREERIARIKSRNHLFHIINYDGLYPFASELYEKDYNLIIFDESSFYLKHLTAHRVWASCLLADKAKYKIHLTGTPVSNHPITIWTQFRVLDGGKTFGNDFYKWRWYFFEAKDYGKFKTWSLKKDKVKELTDKIYSIAVRFGPEVLDLPEKAFSIIEIPLENPLKSLYEEVVEEILISIAKENLTITNILTRLMKLRQITSGFIITDNKTEIELDHQPKLDALMEQIEIIQDSEEPLVVWCTFLKSISMISERCNKKKIRNLTISGADGKNRGLKVEKYQKSDDINVIIGQSSSGGLGTELFKINSVAEYQHMLYYENNWPLDIRDQSEERIHRIGQTAKCHYVDFFIKNTIDVKIYKALKEKRSIAELIEDGGIVNFLKKEKEND